jgi:hypothetical protein
MSRCGISLWFYHIVIIFYVIILSKKGKCKAITLQVWTGPECSRFQDNLTHEGDKVVSPTHRSPLPSQEIFLVLISVRGWVDPQGHSAARRIMSLKNSSDTIRNRTRDLPNCSAVPQPTAPPSDPITLSIISWIFKRSILRRMLTYTRCRGNNRKEILVRNITKILDLLHLLVDWHRFVFYTIRKFIEYENRSLLLLVLWGPSAYASGSTSALWLIVLSHVLDLPNFSTSFALPRLLSRESWSCNPVI